MFSITSLRQLVAPRLFRRLGLAGLVLTMLFASTVEPAHSAGSRQSDEPVYRMSLAYRELAKKNYLCIGEKMTIRVEVFEATSLESQTGFPITALATGKTGTVTPDEAWPGIRSKIPETAEFVYEAKKTGKEKIFFEAIVPDTSEIVPLTGPPPGDYVEKSLEFEVKKCKQKVSLIYQDQFDTGYHHRESMGLIEDAIIEQDDDGVYHGSADLEWNGFNEFPYIEPSCGLKPYTIISPAEITAQPEDVNDSLSLKITYSDVPHDVGAYANCYVPGGSIYVTPFQLQLGPATAAVPFPSSGGVIHFQDTETQPFVVGTYTILIEPEEEQPSVSVTSEPVAWLLGWFEGALVFHVKRD